MPKAGDLAAAKKKLRQVLAEIALIQNAPSYRKTERETLRAKIRQRLSTMSEMRLRSITRRVNHE